MSTVIQNYQLHIALLDIQQLNSIATQIKKGVSTDVLNVFSQNVSSINKRQGITSKIHGKIGTESYRELSEIALEGVQESFLKIWTAVYKAVQKIVSAIKEKYLNFTDMFRDEIKVLERTKTELIKMDQTLVFNVSDIEKYAKYLCNSGRVFKISDAAKNLENYTLFIKEFILAVEKASKQINQSMQKVLKGESDNISKLVILDLNATSHYSTSKDDGLYHSFGCRSIVVDTEGVFALTLSDLEDAHVGVLIPKSFNVTIVDKTATVAQAVKMLDASILALSSKDAVWGPYDSLFKTLDNISEMSSKYEKSLNSEGLNKLHNGEDDISNSTYLLGQATNECIAIVEALFGFADTFLYEGAKALSGIAKEVLKAK